MLAARVEHQADFARRHRQAPYHVTLDREEFAPVRLVFELGRGVPYPPAGKDGTNSAALFEALETQGWRCVRHTDDEFENLYQAYEAECERLDPNGKPRCFHHPTEPKVGRVFVVPNEP